MSQRGRKKERRAQADAGEPRLSPAKRRAFMAVTLLFPFLLVAFAEGILRVAGYGESHPLFVADETRPEYLRQNPEVARRYFRNTENVPRGLVDYFDRDKREGSFRIVVQGASSAAGFPFYYGAAFSRLLQDRLQESMPERLIEVVNTAVAAVNSYTLVDFADEIIRQRPDAVVIYAGHNEYYGALGVGSTESMGGMPPGAVRTLLYLQRYRVVQAVQQGLSGLASTADDLRRDGTLMERMVREQHIPYGSVTFERGLRQFESNLSVLLRKYQRAGIPVFIATLASNERDHAPFVSLNGRPEYSDRSPVVERLLVEGRFEEAVAESRMMVESAPEWAMGHFLIGRGLLGIGDVAGAREALERARDLDALRFRAPGVMNDIIRRTAEAHGATVVEVRDVLASSSPDRLVGAELMTEHLHPNVEGYFLIADAFYDVLVGSGVLGQSFRRVGKESARHRIAFSPIDSLVGAYRVAQLKSHWPFQPAGTRIDFLDTLIIRSETERIARDLFLERISWTEARRQERALYEDRGDLESALLVARAEAQELSIYPDPYVVAGALLLRLGRPPDALAWFERSLQFGETATARRLTGAIILQRGDHALALPHLERAVELAPANIQGLYNLAGAYALAGRYSDSRRTAGRLLEITPDHDPAMRLLASLP
jgi:tetratricopeptide (TPR) repeat protein